MLLSDGGDDDGGSDDASGVAKFGDDDTAGIDDADKAVGGKDTERVEVVMGVSSVLLGSMGVMTICQRSKFNGTPFLISNRIWRKSSPPYCTPQPNTPLRSLPVPNGNNDIEGVASSDGNSNLESVSHTQFTVPSPPQTRIRYPFPFTANG